MWGRAEHGIFARKLSHQLSLGAELREAPPADWKYYSPTHIYIHPFSSSNCLIKASPLYIIVEF